jgi:hypothetical protein
MASVVDPDPVGYGSGKNHSGSGSVHLRVQNEFEVNYSVQLIKFDNFSKKMLNLKVYIPFYQKEFPKRLLLVIICNITQLNNYKTGI